MVFQLVEEHYLLWVSVDWHFVIFSWFVTLLKAYLMLVVGKLSRMFKCFQEERGDVSVIVSKSFCSYYIDDPLFRYNFISVYFFKCSCRL